MITLKTHKNPMFRKIKLYQERDFGEVVNATFLFLRQNFKPLFGAHLRINGPLLLLLVILTIGGQMLVGYDFRATFDSSSMAWYTSTTDFWISNLIAGVASIVFFISISLVTAAYIKLYQQLEDGSPQTIGVDAIWVEMKSRMASTVGAVLLYFLAVAVGAMLCGIPGIFALAAFWLYMPAIFFDRSSGYDALGRSYEVVKGNWWFTFGVLIVISIIAAVIGVVINLPAIVLSTVLALTSMSDSGELTQYSPTFYLWSAAVTLVLSYVSSILTYTIVGIGAFFQYGTLVEAKEGRGLTADINETLNEPATPED
jgi:hypothetical protein